MATATTIARFKVLVLVVESLVARAIYVLPDEELDEVEAKIRAALGWPQSYQFTTFCAPENNTHWITGVNSALPALMEGEAAAVESFANRRTTAPYRVSMDNHINRYVGVKVQLLVEAPHPRPQRSVGADYGTLLRGPRSSANRTGQSARLRLPSVAAVLVFGVGAMVVASFLAVLCPFSWATRLYITDGAVGAAAAASATACAIAIRKANRLTLAAVKAVGMLLVAVSLLVLHFAKPDDNEKMAMMYLLTVAAYYKAAVDVGEDMHVFT